MARKGKSSGGRSSSSNRQRNISEPEAVEEAEVISEIRAEDVEASAQQTQDRPEATEDAPHSDAALTSTPDPAAAEASDPDKAQEAETSSASDGGGEGSAGTPADPPADKADDAAARDAGPAWISNTGSGGGGSSSSSSSAAASPSPKRGGMSALLGGVLAAGLGGGAVYMLGQDGMPLEGAFGGNLAAQLDAANAQTETLQSEIEAMQAALEAMQAQVSDQVSRATAPLEERVEALNAGLEQAQQDSAAALSSLAEQAQSQVTDLTARMDELERLPFSEAVSETAIAAYESELADLIASVEGARDALDSQMAERSAELEAMMASSRDDIAARTDEINQLIAEAEAARQEAARLEEAARRAEALANAQADLADMRVAMSEGEPYADALSEITAVSGIEAPEALATPAADGLPTLSALIEQFPDLARAALSAARAEGEGAPEAEESNVGSRLTAFLDSRFQTRSVVPREGDGADAVLSRAEAAVAAGDLDTALTEIEALSEAARAPLADWVARATARRDALDALDALDAQLTSQQG